jgi:tRNA A37 threonylcarbamoyladenosine modification protein TsaB
LAYAVDKPVIGLNHLEVHALICAIAHQVDVVAVAHDARMSEVYTACYDNLQARLSGQQSSKRLLDPCVVSPEQAYTLISAALADDSLHDVTYCGEAWDLYKTQLPVVISAAATLPLSASMFAQLAPLFVTDAVAACDTQPYYVRNQVAKTLAERRALGSLI